MATPVGKSSLHLSLLADYDTIPNGRVSNFHLVAEVRAMGGNEERKRLPLAVILVLDVSGSMAGQPIEQVISSVDRLVDFLEPSDRVGLVAFSTNATEIMPLKAVDADTKKLVKSRVHRMQADGSTNIEDGLRKAAAMFSQRQVILLLNDGQPNVGASSPQHLGAQAASMRPNISISSLGFGTHHDQDVLLAISGAGGGNYHWIKDAAICGMEFAEALSAQADIIAEKIEVCLLPSQDVEIVKVLGNIPTRFSMSGLMVPLPDLKDGAECIVVTTVSLNPAEECPKREIAKCVLRYRNVENEEIVSTEQTLYLGVGKELGAIIPSVYHKTLLILSNEARAEARAMADRGQFEGAAALLRNTLKRIQQAPGFVMGDNSPLAELYEILLDEATGLERKPSQEKYQELRDLQGCTMTLDIADISRTTRPKKPPQNAFVATMAGKFPKGFLEVVGGEEDGRKIILNANQVIGRTASADIQFNNATVSRQHAQIFAKQGAFYILDWGSHNTTRVNGKVIGDSHKLAKGDIIEIGHVKVRYDEST